MSRHRFRALREEKPGIAPAIDKWLDDPNSILTTILIGLNAVNILAAIIAENIADYIIEKNNWPGWLGPVFSFGIVSLVIIEFCEMMPKFMGYHNSEGISVKMIRPMVMLKRLMSPMVRGMVKIANFTIRLITGKSGPNEGPFITQSEILGVVDTGEEDGVIDKDEREMIYSIIEFGDTQVREVMTPRPDMVCAPASTTIEEMAHVIEASSHSRIPVFEDNEDNIIGIINSRAVLKALKEEKDKEPARNFIHEAYFVPESKMIDDLLHNFQIKRTQLALVVDEYGSTVGLVSLEDLLEEIVGEIWDEYDTEERLYRWIAEDTLRVDARIDIKELNELLDAGFSDDQDYETLAGLILHQIGRLPRTGENFMIDRHELKIEKMVGRRIATVIIKKPVLKEHGEDTGSK